MESSGRERMSSPKTAGYYLVKLSINPIHSSVSYKI